VRSLTFESLSLRPPIASIHLPINDAAGRRWGLATRHHCFVAVDEQGRRKAPEGDTSGDSHRGPLHILGWGVVIVNNGTAGVGSRPAQAF